MAHTIQRSAQTVLIVNKYPGTCKDCGTDVARRAGIAVKEDGRWQVLCAEHAGETHGLLNPWRDDHHFKDSGYTGGEYSRARSRAMVDSEYRNTDALSRPCPCGDRMWWRPTVGAPQCVSCGAIYSSHVDQATGQLVERILT
ncbi:hypothetical protein [Actinomadura nitritigenes]|uniref:hypothetical protein n=1 Tax=Actinomadura nitritigenes TaxID=134602 RepID=UPI003D8C4925